MTTEADSLWCSQLCCQLGRSIALTRKNLWEISIAVSELVTNTLKFAGSGRVDMTVLNHPRPGLDIKVTDDGPGIADVVAAVRDGFSEGAMLTPDERARPRRGLGSGLGAVARLMDEMEIDNPAEGGTRVIARKWCSFP